jgi:PAS domain S-box-containing protein
MSEKASKQSGGGQWGNSSINDDENPHPLSSGGGCFASQGKQSDGYNAVVLTDDLGRVVFWSRAAEEMFLRTARDMLGQNLEVVLDRDAGHPAALPALGILGDASGAIRDTLGRRANGALFPLEVSVTRLRDQYFAGKGVTFLAVFRDATARQCSRYELDKLHSELLHAQKMQAVGQLVGGVAHDFNNILSAVLIQLGLLRMEKPSGSELQTQIGELEAQALRASALTRQLLLLSRRETVCAEVVDLNLLLNNQIKMFSRIIRENIRIERAGLATEHLWIEADPGRIEQVIMNLAINARDAMPDGGVLRFETGHHYLQDAPSPAGADTSSGHWIRFSIQDTGCGIPPAVKERMFEPFFTTKEAGQGTGLGLSTVRAIVKEHRGWIDVDSIEGKGSLFSVFFPACDVSTLQEVQEASVDSCMGGRETILFVEDDRSVRQLAASLLRQIGYTVFEAQDARTALALWKVHSESIDLLVTDIIMPGTPSGRELAGELLRQKSSLKMLFISGYSADVLHSVSDFPDGSSFLSKPISGRDLARNIRNLLDSRR